MRLLLLACLLLTGCTIRVTHSFEHAVKCSCKPVLLGVGYECECRKVDDDEKCKESGE